MRALALAALATVAGCSHKAAPSEEEAAAPIVVQCAPVATTAGDQPLTLRGRIAPPPRAVAVVAAPGPGRVSRVLVDEGDQVSAGQLVAVLDDPGLGASAIESTSDLAVATAELKAATAERVRRSGLVAQGISPAKDLEEADAREATARANVAAATARRSLARGNLARAELRAPRAGVVLRVRRRAGEVVDGSDPTIIELADLSTLELSAQLTGAELLGLAVGGAATVVIDARPDLPLPATVVAVAPALDDATGLGLVRVRLTEIPAGLHLAVGLAGVATVAHRGPTGITIPTVAIRRSLAGTDEVLVCAGDPIDRVEVRAVTVGARHADVTTVGGLVAGEQVVVDHVLALADGAAVTTQADTAPAPTPTAAPMPTPPPGLP
ncbi:MAG: efflux RND transporter periplasmic adaptor subunit [Kofleriaceae bacterium]